MRDDPWHDAYFNDGPVTVNLSHRRIKAARKQHTCTLCRRPIEVGSTYYQDVMIHEGAFTINRVHDLLGTCSWSNPNG